MTDRLVLGPMLRYVGGEDALVWVETGWPCLVEVRAGAASGAARTFEVEGHHYALVYVERLTKGTVTPYDVLLDGDPVWPAADSDMPPPVIRTADGSEDLTVAFGSCRVGHPHAVPYTLTKKQDPEGREVDALRTLALRMVEQPPSARPHVCLLLGDQVYADDVSPATKEFIAARRNIDEPPGDTIADFEEYTALYKESWGEPIVRWLLSTVPTAMIFDDHDVNDDWNISKTWVEMMRATDWWDDRIVGGFMSYWLYQHAGNLSPQDLGADPLYRKLTAAEGDAGPILREFAYRADREVESVRWSFKRDFGQVRLLIVDSRAGRVLTPRERRMVDDHEWQWLVDNATGDFDHLLIGTSLPWLLSSGMHYLEALDERLCDGYRGRRLAELAEKARQALDLEHWAAFRASFDRLAQLIGEVGSGRRGRPPASIVVLSGDVHHAYLSEVAYPRGEAVVSAVYQAVCSPFRNPLGGKERLAMRLLHSRAATVVGRAVGRLGGVPDPPVRWRLTHDEPVFGNQIASLRIHDRAAEFVLERTVAGEPGAPPRLVCSLRKHLTVDTFTSEDEEQMSATSAISPTP